jgi:hypothetical protein
MGSGLQYSELATYKGTAFALRSYEAYSPGNPIDAMRLVASLNLSSWHSVDNAISGAGGSIHSFWLNPSSGSILAYTTSSSSGFWDSGNGGQSWSALASPSLQPDLVAVQPSVGDEPWHLCAAQQILANPAHSYNLLACTSDGGHTWSSRPALNLSLSQGVFIKGSGQLNNSKAISGLGLFAFEPDGSLLAAVLDTSMSDGTTPLGIYRLPLGSGSWQSLGRAPYSGGSFMTFATGVIWFSNACPANEGVSQPFCYTAAAGAAYVTDYL